MPTATSPRKYAPHGTYPNKLRAVRERLGLSRLEAARRVGLHWITLYRHETGQISASTKSMRLYATAYKVPLITLWCDIPESEPESEESEPAR